VLGWALRVKGGGGGGEHRIAQRSSKLGIKTNILNAKFDFLHTKDFKLATYKEIQ